MNWAVPLWLLCFAAMTPLYLACLYLAIVNRLASLPNFWELIKLLLSIVFTPLYLSRLGAIILFAVGLLAAGCFTRLRPGALLALSASGLYALVYCVSVLRRAGSLSGVGDVIFFTPSTLSIAGSAYWFSRLVASH